MDTMRDLGCADLWAKSLEQSLARRGRPRRASVELYRLKPERDLSSPRPLRESSAYWHIRRTAVERAAMPLTTAGGGAALALLAATTLPSLLGARGTGKAAQAQTVEPARASGKLSDAVNLALAASKTRRAVPAELVSLAHSPAPSGAAVPAIHQASVHGAILMGTVAGVQHLLGVSADGVLGPQTATAIRSFQSAHGLTVDGIVGPATWTALTRGAKKAEVGAKPARATHTQAPAHAGATLAGVRAAPTRTAPGTAHAVVADVAHTTRTAHQAGGATPSAGPVSPSTRPATPATHTTAPSTRPATPATHTTTRTTAPSPRPTHHAAPTSTAAPTAGPVASAPRSPAKTATPPTASKLTGVRALQQRLGLTPDGDFGPMTKAAVERFQRAHGLKPDGIVGPGTRAALGLGAGPTLKEPGATSTTGGETTTTGSPTATTPGPTTTTPSPSGSVSAELAAMVAAGNAIATKPYVYGGGHGSFTSVGYDCSGSVSYVLHAAGLLSSPEDSTGLESYGAAGPGRYVTIYANAGHAWMTINGRRFDTVALQETGTRWSSSMASTSGYVVRHPVGL